MRADAWAALLSAALVAAGVPACQPDRASSGKAPPNAGGGAAGQSGAHAGAAGFGGAGVGGVGGDVEVPPEPPGEDVLTLVHGAVDAARLWFCFARATGGTLSPGSGLPTPSDGLAYARSLSLDGIDGFDPSSDTLVPVAIAAAAAAEPGLDCAEAVDLAVVPPAAGGEPRVLALPAIAAGTLNRGRGYTVVVNGCFGAPELAHEHAEHLCGLGYTPETPTLTAVLVSPSRLVIEGRSGLQVVNAASWGLDAGSIDVRSTRGSGAPIVLASDVTAGAIVPRPPLYVDPSVLEAEAADARLEILWQGQTVTGNVAWADVRARAGAGLEPGHNYALVVVGPSPIQEYGPGFWNPLSFSLVETSVGVGG